MIPFGEASHAETAIRRRNRRNTQTAIRRGGGILLCCNFVDRSLLRSRSVTQPASDSGTGIRGGSNKRNQADAPYLVNLAFSIELYIKLLRFLADGRRMRGHNLHALFQKLEKAAPAVAEAVFRHHRHAPGNRDEFAESLTDVKSIFEDWRYAYEHELLVAVPDSVLALADAFRGAMKELHPTRRSVFEAMAQ
jgi:hypothetical protein